MYERKTIKEFPLFQVSTSGEIISIGRRWGSNGKKGIIFREKIIVPCDNGKGYKQYFMYCDKQKKHMRYIHRLVAQAFIPIVEGKTQINHKDGNKSNNNVNNLEWCTKSENMTHAVNTGLYTVLKIVRISDNGDRKIYNSVREATIENNLAKTGIRGTLSGKQASSGGFKWEYAND